MTDYKKLIEEDEKTSHSTDWWNGYWGGIRKALYLADGYPKAPMIEKPSEYILKRMNEEAKK